MGDLRRRLPSLRTRFVVYFTVKKEQEDLFFSNRNMEVTILTSLLINYINGSIINLSWLLKKGRLFLFYSF